MRQSNELNVKRAARLAAAAVCAALAMGAQAQPPAGAQPARPQAGRGPGPGAMASPKAGVCPLPVLPALPEIADASFYQKTSVAHGRVEKPTYRTQAGAEKRLHVYLPADYEKNPNQRYPVLYLNHGGGDDDSAWTREDVRSGAFAANILDNLIAAGKAKPMIVVMPNTRDTATSEPSPLARTISARPNT